MHHDPSCGHLSFDNCIICVRQKGKWTNESAFANFGGDEFYRQDCMIWERYAAHESVDDYNRF
jgi:hypothetical protein